MSELYSQQKSFLYLLERSLENFKKYGKNNYTPARIRARISALNDTWSKCVLGHAALTQAIPEDQRDSYDYFQLNHFDLADDLYNRALEYMTECLEELEPVSPHSGNCSTHHPSHIPTSFSLAHLPPIHIPPFAGRFEEWESFRDRFKSLIIDNHDLTPVTRMHFLISSLTGRALDSIKDLPVTAANFEVAWQALTARYENKRRLIEMHVSALYNLPAVGRESAEELSSLQDRANRAISSLRNLKRTADEALSDLFVYSVSQKLDAASLRAWKLKGGEENRIPTYDDLDRFIAARVHALEEITASQPARFSPLKGSSRVSVATASAISCPLCKAAHFLTKCPLFATKSPSQRLDIVHNTNRCTNCLSGKHSTRSCPSRFTCRICQQRHHSMLHFESPSDALESNVSPARSVDSPIGTEAAVLQSTSTWAVRSPVFLATARVAVMAPSGRRLVIRAMMDPGSELTFISERLTQLLSLRRFRRPIAISAIGGINAGTTHHATHIKISPCNEPDPTISLTASILGNLTHYSSPRVELSSQWSHLTGLTLADPHLTSSDPIDLLIGSDIYGETLLDGLRRGGSGQPIAQHTIFGWVISGPSAPGTTPSLTASSHCAISLSLDHELRKFWEIEEVPHPPHSSPEERLCEEHFLKTYSRAPNGRYIVRLPFKQGPPIAIGESRTMALRQLSRLQQHLQRNPNLSVAYDNFLADYEALGHMRKTTETRGSQCVYIPHHAVMREGSNTTHLRVVFNASQNTTNSSSLNDHLLSSPKLQNDLTAVILRWRQYRYVYSADIAKMYRQILVDHRDVDYQRILWSSGERNAVHDYQLLTVTYGTAAAPFLALRVLRQLLLDEGAVFPLAVPVLKDNIYVDDVLFGADDIQLIRQIREQVCDLLRRGHFHLRKWSSNSAALLHGISAEDHGLACDKTLQSDEQLKILGISWNPSQDIFQFNVSLPEGLPNTKRSILSTIARLFDPLGWGTPVTISAKIFLQRLWLLKLDWDDRVPPQALAQWSVIYSSLSSIDGCKISRWIQYGADTASCELHGFSDASNSAYAAVVYLRVTSRAGHVSTALLMGKSKVAPVKVLSVPRLELSAAVLLSRLIEFAQSTLQLSSAPCYCWTDSTVVLAWIQQHPSKWKTFVANRVADIQSRLPQARWHHVSTRDNPSDCASRGILGHQLPSHTLWWYGPTWLRLTQDEWPIQAPPNDTAVEAHSPASVSLSLTADSWDLATRYSSWPKLMRVTAYILRFVANLRRSVSSDITSSASSRSLSSNEIIKAKMFWLRYIQAETFSSEREAMRTRKSLATKSALSPLNPFIDQAGLIRVGGRLRHSPIPFTVKHPIVLAAHPVVNLIIRHAHLRALHAGTQLTLATLRQEYWILRGRCQVKAILHRCVTCARERAELSKQRMGDLPRVRMSPPERAFLHCGLDYAGPFLVRALPGRGRASHKAYIAIWICMATRAIHLELVEGYATSSFLAAYSRFCSRRGFPATLYSDNGTTFVGANRELTRAFRAALRDPDFQNRTASDHVQWHFIPPSAPHFGGLWEAGVRSVKHHMRRVVGAHTLTFEEFTTLLCNVEACLNSRPLAPLTDTLEDYQALTPGHFLIGSAITAIPEPSILHLKENRLSRWQLVRQMFERYWKLWQTDYVNLLLQRSKWKTISAKPVRTGHLVLLQNPTLPPCKWELGRIMQCHPGEDGLVRVVTVKTATSEYKRPITKLCLLPIDLEDRDRLPDPAQA